MNSISRSVALLFVLAVPLARAQYSSREFTGLTPTGGEVPLGAVCRFAGDVDHDGRSDLLIGAPAHLIVVSGATATALYDIPYGCRSVAAVYDVDADGHDDFMAGGGSQIVVFSGATGLPLRTYPVTTSLAWQQAGTLQQSLAAVGDVDADGFVDTAIGAYYGHLNQLVPGAAHVVSGATGAVIHTLFGDDDFEQFGSAVAGIGDVNGDGLDDLVVGAPDDHDGGGLWSGTASIFDSATWSRLHVLVPGVGSAHTGTCLAGLGDVDADGVGDVAVGGTNTSSGPTSKVRIHSGATGAILRIIAPPNTDRCPDLAAAGDHDGDGIADLIVGTHSYLSFNDHAESAILYSSTTGAALRTFRGFAPNTWFGSSVAGGGDSNGDGQPDLVVADAPIVKSASVTLFESSCQTLYAYGYGSTVNPALGPKLQVIGCVGAAGGALTLSVQNAYGGGIAVILVGLQPTYLFAFPDSVLAVLALPVPAMTLPLGGSGPGAGTASVSFSLSASQLPVDAFLQAVASDPAPPGFRLSNGFLIGKPGT